MIGDRRNVTKSGGDAPGRVPTGRMFKSFRAGMFEYSSPPEPDGDWRYLTISGMLAGDNTPGAITDWKNCRPDMY